MPFTIEYKKISRESMFSSDDKIINEIAQSMRKEIDKMIVEDIIKEHQRLPIKSRNRNTIKIVI